MKKIVYVTIKGLDVCCSTAYVITTVNLPDAVVLVGAYSGSRSSPVGLQGCMICCSGQ